MHAQSSFIILVLDTHQKVFTFEFEWPTWPGPNTKLDAFENAHQLGKKILSTVMIHTITWALFGDQEINKIKKVTEYARSCPHVPKYLLLSLLLSLASPMTKLQSRQLVIQASHVDLDDFDISLFCLNMESASNQRREMWTCEYRMKRRIATFWIWMYKQKTGGTDW